MFLGTHTPRLDDKGRLALPARFRPELEGGLVICKGQDRCLFVFPTDEFTRFTAALADAPVTDRRVRDYGRVLFASASRETPDGQGRITVPPQLRQYAGLSKDCVVIGANTPHRGLGRRDLARPTSRAPSRPSPTSPRRCCPACCDRSADRELRSRPPPVRLLTHFPGARRTGRAGTRSQLDPRPLPTRLPTDHSTPDHAQRAAPMDASGRAPAMQRERGATSRSCSSACSPCSPRRSPTGAPSSSTPPSAWAATPRRCSTAHPQLTLVGLDRDPAALAAAGTRLARFAGRTHLVHAVYDRMPDVLAALGLDGVDGVLFDLGVSSMQLDLAERGFAYAQDAPLDMRMDHAPAATAADSRQRLSGRRPGTGAARVRRGAVRAADRPGDRSGPPQRPRSLDRAAGRTGARRDPGGDPAHTAGTRPSAPSRRCASRSTASWTRCAPRCPPRSRRCAVGGRIVVLSYHSLEDRIVKQSLAALAADTTPVGLPVPLADRGPHLRLLTRGSEAASTGRDRRQPARRVRTAARRRESGRSREAHRTGRRRAQPRRADAARTSARPQLGTHRRPGAHRSSCSSWACSSAAWRCCSR